TASRKCATFHNSRPRASCSDPRRTRIVLLPAASRSRVSRSPVGALQNPMITELIGWTAATILLATIGRQAYSQWRDRSSQGVSKWLFIGQITASTGFVIYSWLLRDWVFVVTNVLMLNTALFGQWIYLHNKRRQRMAQ